MERVAKKTNGFLTLLGILISLIGAIYFFIQSESQILYMIPGFGLVLALIVLASTIVVVLPNESYVVTFFGKYKGTVRDSGFWSVIPLSNKQKVSLRVRNFTSAKLKVNDVEGNPIEIAAVIVFNVVDTARATFDVENYEHFVEIQSEAALRHVASKYPYDHYHEKGYSLRANPLEVSEELTKELQDRLSLAGVRVLEARLTHLAYSMEIAGAMLQRQQASAILAARQTIVEGAVGIVTAALDQIEKQSNVRLSEEKKASMINNLLVTIVSERGASPVIQAGKTE